MAPPTCRCGHRLVGAAAYGEHVAAAARARRRATPTSRSTIRHPMRRVVLVGSGGESSPSVLPGGGLTAPALQPNAVSGGAHAADRLSRCSPASGSFPAATPRRCSSTTARTCCRRVRECAGGAAGCETLRPAASGAGELVCGECGAVSVDGAGWRAELAPDDEGVDALEVPVYCPGCWESEFGAHAS